MTRLRRALQHMLNPLHIYCRLREFGVGSLKAQRVCGAYERFVYRLFTL